MRISRHLLLLVSLTILMSAMLQSVVYAEEDYYKVMGLKRDATEAEIKKKFKKLAIKNHPDKNKDDPDRAKARFQ
jgi:preprotein translocase subunit Sec63